MLRQSSFNCLQAIKFPKILSQHSFSDKSFLFMEYYPEATLHDVINAYMSKGKRLDENVAMFYTIELLRIMEALHKCGIIHGDIKPDNLLVVNPVGLVM